MPKTGYVLATGLLATTAVAVMTQDVINGDFLKCLGYNENEIECILEIQTATAKGKLQTQVELNLYQAQLEKLLLDPDVDLSRVEKLPREATKLKVRGELADIRRRVQLRSITGATIAFPRMLIQMAVGKPRQAMLLTLFYRKLRSFRKQ